MTIAFGIGCSCHWTCSVGSTYEEFFRLLIRRATKDRHDPRAGSALEERVQQRDSGRGAAVSKIKGRITGWIAAQDKGVGAEEDSLRSRPRNVHMRAVRLHRVPL